MFPEFGYALAFTTGLLGAGHCLGMCGGMASGYFAGQGWSQRLAPHLKYHGMRIATYVLLGAAGAGIGRVLVQAGIVGKFQGLLMIATGLAVILIGAWFSGLLRRGRDRAGPDHNGLIVHFDQNPRARRYLPALAGLLNGLVPCSLVFSVAVKTVGTADFFQAGLLMLCFGLGTLPTMWLVTTAGAVIGDRGRDWMRRLTGIVIVALGGWTLYEGWIFYDIMRGLAN
jgi:sulfite exporter TauE/SafE